MKSSLAKRCVSILINVGNWLWNLDFIFIIWQATAFFRFLTNRFYGNLMTLIFQQRCEGSHYKSFYMKNCKKFKSGVYCVLCRNSSNGIATIVKIISVLMTWIYKQKKGDEKVRNKKEEWNSGKNTTFSHQVFFGFTKINLLIFFGSGWDVHLCWLLI